MPQKSNTYSIVLSGSFLGAFATGLQKTAALHRVGKQTGRCLTDCFVVRFYLCSAGGNGPHSGARRNGIGLATAYTHALAGLAPTTGTATIWSKAQRIVGGQLRVLLTPEDCGQLKLALLMPDIALDGFEKGRCIAISENRATARVPQWHVVAWAEGRSLTELNGQSAVLRFDIAGPLFAFMFERQQVENTVASSESRRQNPYPVFWAVNGPNAPDFSANGSVNIGQYDIKTNNFTICGGMMGDIMPRLSPSGMPSNGGVPQRANMPVFLEGLTKAIDARVPDPAYAGLVVFDFEAWTRKTPPSSCHGCVQGTVSHLAMF